MAHPTAQHTFFDSNPEYATLIYAAQDARAALGMALSGELDALLAHEGASSTSGTAARAMRRCSQPIFPPAARLGV